MKIITINDYKKALEQAHDTCSRIPTKYNRLYETSFNREVIQNLEKVPDRKPTGKWGMVIFKYTKNLSGYKRWGNYITVFDTILGSEVIKVTDKSIITKYNRISIEKVVAIVRG